MNYRAFIISLLCLFLSINSFSDNKDIPVEGLVSISYKNGKAGVVNAKGEVIIPYIHKQILFPNDGHFGAGKYNDYKELVYGYYDLSGELVIPFQYEQVSYFRDGLAPVKQNRLWGFIDYNGDWLIEPKYNKASHFTNGHALVTEGNDTYFINLKGENSFDKTFQRAQKFYHGYAKVTDETGKAYIIDSLGKDLVAEGYNSSTIYPDAKLLEVGKAGKMGIQDINGTILIPALYDEIGSFRHDDFSYVVKNIGGNRKFAFVSKTHQFLSDFDFDAAEPFSHNTAVYGTRYRAESELKYGLINHKGIRKTEAIYDKIQLITWGDPTIKHSYFVATKSKKKGLINDQGKVILPFAYNNIYNNRRGFFRAQKGDTWYLYNAIGKEIFKTNELYINSGSLLKSNVFHARNKKTKLNGLIDREGNWLIKPEYGMLGPLRDLNGDISI